MTTNPDKQCADILSLVHYKLSQTSDQLYPRIPYSPQFTQAAIIILRTHQRDAKPNTLATIRESLRSSLTCISLVRLLTR